MAWASQEEEALHHIGQHMGVMEVEKRRELSDLYTRLIFPQQNHTWSDIKWTTLWGVTFITMWDEEHLQICYATRANEDGSKELLHPH